MDSALPRSNPICCRSWMSCAAANRSFIRRSLARRQPSSSAHGAGVLGGGRIGRRYSREFILAWAGRSPSHFVDAEAAGWRTGDFGLRRLGPDTYLLTYTLDQAGRRTQRSTIWQHSEAGWRILYHQGTIIAAEEDDTIP